MIWQAYTKVIKNANLPCRFYKNDGNEEWLTQRARGAMRQIVNILSLKKKVTL